jgi:hypothetical protein
MSVSCLDLITSVGDYLLGLKALQRHIAAKYFQIPALCGPRIWTSAKTALRIARPR